MYYKEFQGIFKIWPCINLKIPKTVMSTLNESTLYNINNVNILTFLFFFFSSSESRCG